MKEIWKSIKNYESLYDASNFGRVRSLKFGKVRILKPGKTKKGYLYVCLCKDRKQKQFYVHRLVYETFNGTIPEGYEINHIDENTENNCLSNLSAVSHKTNINYGTRNKRVSVAMTNGKLSDPVLQLTLDEVLVKEWPSISEAGRNGFNQGAVWACCRGKLKQYKGFRWVKKKIPTRCE